MNSMKKYKFYNSILGVGFRKKMLTLISIYRNRNTSKIVNFGLWNNKVNFFGEWFDSFEVKFYGNLVLKISHMTSVKISSFLIKNYKKT